MRTPSNSVSRNLSRIGAFTMMFENGIELSLRFSGTKTPKIVKQYTRKLDESTQFCYTLSRFRSPRARLSFYHSSGQVLLGLFRSTQCSVERLKMVPVVGLICPRLVQGSYVLPPILSWPLRAPMWYSVKTPTFTLVSRPPTSPGCYVLLPLLESCWSTMKEKIELRGPTSRIRVALEALRTLKIIRLLIHSFTSSL